MPATLTIVVVLLGWLPEALERRRVNGWPVRATVLAAIVVAVWAHLFPMRYFFGLKQVTVGWGSDQFLADDRGGALNRVLAVLTIASGPQDTLVMLPEGLMVNYLARRANPTGQLNFTPPAIIMYGEDRMLDALRHDAPDWIGVSNVDTSEYGAALFGRDYGQLISEWISQQYERRAPLASRFNIRLMRRNAITPDTQPSDN
jgi:hypothetical protein